MATKLVRLYDDVLVEVETGEDGPDRISSNAARRAELALESVQDLLRKAVKPVTSVWAELNRDVTIDEVEISLALGFEAEGNVFIARGTGSANLTFKLTLRPPESSGS